MICPACFDNGVTRDMGHVTGTEHFHNPGAPDGHGERQACWYECRCGHEEDCHEDHDSPFEE